MKRIVIALALAAFLVSGVVGCGGSPTSAAPTKKTP